MTEAVNVAGLVGLITLATILIASAAGGLLLSWVETRTHREEH